MVPAPKPPAPAPKPPVKPAPVPPPAPAPAPPVAGGSIPGWGAPTWRDEFTYVDAAGRPTVDPRKWNVRDQGDLGLLFDAAVPRAEQVSVDKSGILHIRADWLASPVIRPSSQAGPRELWHKTGYLDQRNLGAGDVNIGQAYGRWEIRAKTPSGPNTFGALSAFWLRNNQSGEIDIMEAWGYDDTAVRDQRIDTATTTVHTHTSSPSENRRFIWHHADYGASTPVWKDFHTYAFEFTPTYAAVIVDGVEMLRATPSTHPNLWDPDHFGSPLHMRLNLHVGPSATYWGLPNPADKGATQNLDFQVDYVRVWSYQP
ncbi:glycosyl hydrolase family protein [Microbacterium sp. CGR2]|nr:glycosyl hydrolase family protein [Microbacterium sp. CGR2]